VKILVLGSGAREHAIITALLAETANHDIVVAPGNAGIAHDVPAVNINAEDPEAVVALALGLEMELVVIGPEAPLVAGVADAVRAVGIPVFGPNQNAAALEGSKTFAKRIMDAAGVPTGRALKVSALPDAETALDDFGAPYVIKADGLAAGKGVLVTHDRVAAVAHAAHWLASGDVLIEEFLDGQEVSLFLLADGHDVLPLSPAQDFKRLSNNDEGPNTGGMGAYSPLPWLDAQFGSEHAFVTECIDTVALPTVRQLESEGTPFVGLLYCGLILTKAGIRVIEFNARFGDPETQVVLPRLGTPFSELLLATATGKLAGRARPEFSSDVAVTVVLASENYPETPVTGREITGLDAASAVTGVHIAHAATAFADAANDDSTGANDAGDAGDETSNPKLVATGGRVLSVVALGENFTQARARAYEALELIHLEGGQYRTDIAAKVAQ
jgi:phosphoribosylamine--glycine ligase